MFELLVTLGVLATILGSVLALFFTGVRSGRRGRERTEAARVAQAVFELVDRGFTDGSARGRDQSDGSVTDEIILSQELAGAQELDGTGFPSLWAPTYVTANYGRTPASVPPAETRIGKQFPLVWRCRIEQLASDVPGMHLLTITVQWDKNDNAQFDDDENGDGLDDDFQTDGAVGFTRYRFYAVLAKRG
jgi:type II secretory pathway pseudopilin PulG